MALRWRALGAAAAVALVLGGVAASSGGAARASAPRAAASPTITFYFGLKRPEAQARVAFFAVEQPHSGRYRHFLSTRQLAWRYGASAGTRRSFARVVRKYGFAVSVDPSDVFARVTGSVQLFQQVFKVHIATSFNNDELGDVWFLKGNARMRLPAVLRPLVRDVVPSYTRSAQMPPAPSTDASRTGARGPRRTGRWIDGCAKAKATGAFSFAQVRRAYGIDRLGNGRGASVAILNVAEGVSAQDLADNARCFGYPKLATRTLRIDGQQHPFGQGSFEPEEDLALVRGMAPAMRSLTFSQVWFSAETWFLGVANVLDAPDLPDSLSISYGECERDMRGRGSTPTTRAGADLMDSVLVRLGLAGVGTYASAGDFGSTCNGRPFSGVAWPASSPFATAVGGTRLSLSATNRRRSEVVWNDTRWTPAHQGGGAGGGGVSVVSPRPPFQRATGVRTTLRTTPDVSAAASNFPGWPVVLGGNWISDGGTSASAPLVASAFAVLSRDLRHRHLPPVGPANGLLYYLARRSPATIYDVIRGNNGWSKKVPARHAHPGYDLASGLGVPRFAAIAGSVPRPGR